MPKTLIEALHHRGPITPQLEGPSEYQRNKVLIETARRAARGSMLHLQVLERMSEANKCIAWTFSTADTKARLKTMLDAPGIEREVKVND